MHWYLNILYFQRNSILEDSMRHLEFAKIVPNRVMNVPLSNSYFSTAIRRYSWRESVLKKNRVPILHDRMNFTISFSNIRGKGWRKIYGNVLSISLRVRCYTSSYVCRAMLFHILREYNRSLFKVKFQLQVGKALYRCSCYIILFIFT